ncbi:uncharacterized protein SPSK_06782 [Sporothrix schenckii 1099-18]|uniref:Uncharacterized protein n=1 Tax=Sporothrix schenckii 1099-18 TaxID=1397361 RepID=A0A0F2MKC1_SPOSC|nr:uncharacterized protein SPSK_06782 [Sporothrix schenckii 1099-18]KJR89499.1 hypothetical protein SPSK_06782 [Sporothrix schenckii 1099-18]
MGQPSFQASNAVIYLTYGAFLVLGTGIAWRLRKQTKNSDLLAGNRTQTGTSLSRRLPPRAALFASAFVLH